jgi:two-component system NtrC family response regulator
MARILVVDYNGPDGDKLVDAVAQLGHQADRVGSIGSALEMAERCQYDVVYMGVGTPGETNLEFLPRFRQMTSEPEVIVMTGDADAESAESAVKNGAWALVRLGDTLEQATLPLLTALQYRAERQGRRTPHVVQRDGIIGNDPKITFCIDLMAKAAASEANTLIVGETGTGKELFARAIHANSRRENRAFVVVDCAALPGTLVESVLFGHAQGAFTGADRASTGLIYQADGGTLFLDEVGEMPIRIQKAFLRVLQERRFRPVGANKELGSDFRLVAATNRDLEHLVDRGMFRADLLFRLRSFVLELPPLRTCPGDIRELTTHYINQICWRSKIGTKGYSPEFLDALLAYDWPGNIRELVNTIEQAIASAQDEPTLYRKHLPSHMLIQLERSRDARNASLNGRDEKQPSASKAARIFKP